MAATALLLAGRADATVFSWRDADGVFHFTNQQVDVPPGQLEAFRTFTEVAPSAPAADDPADPPPDPAPHSSGAYAQGVEDGLRIAAEQAHLARELAGASAESSTLVAAPIEIAQPPPSVYVSVVPSYAGYGYDYGGWDGCGYGGCGWYGGSVFLGTPFFGRDRFFGRGQHFGHRSLFVGRHGMRGMRGHGGRGHGGGGGGFRGR